MELKNSNKQPTLGGKYNSRKFCIIKCERDINHHSLMLHDTAGKTLGWQSSNNHLK